MAIIAQKDLHFYMNTEIIIDNFMDCPEKVLEFNNKVKTLASRLKGSGHKIQLSYDSSIPHCLEISSHQNFRAAEDFEMQCEKLGMSNVFI